MNDIEQRLKDLKIELPQAAPAAANYAPYVLEGNQLFIAGQLPMWNSEKRFIGKVGDMFSIEEGQAAARFCALNILAQAKAALDGDLGRIRRTMKVVGFVNCNDDFTQHPQVINGASDLLGEVLGDAGRHARCAVGVSSLPFGVAVEIDAVFSVTTSV